MGLDMYAFSLDRSPAFNKPRDVLNYRLPANGQELPEGPILLGLSPDMLSGLGLELLELLPPWASSSPSLDVGQQFLTSKYVLPGSTLLHRWRKHPGLHGWMERRWKSMQWHKGGHKAFGCETRVPLDVQTLDALEHAVETRRLPLTAGPHFGVSDGTEMADDLAFIATARREIAAGKFVYYTSWW